MVCSDCKEAGETITRMVSNPPGDNHADRVLYRMALRLHGQCRGGTWCDCAHVVPAVITCA